MKIYKAKKSLGQNFLKSTLALNKIVESGEVSLKDTVLEIGPGKGALTEKLLQCVYPHPTSPYVGGGAKGEGGSVIAVEKDRELFEFLQEKFSSQIKSGLLILKNEDILKFDCAKLKNYKIIANIPYNITGAILKKFLTEKNQPEYVVLMVQYEVAKRIVARDAKESILSISVKAYGEPKMIMKVPARYFSPAPKVDSAIISIKNISRKIFQDNGINEERFWEIVKKGFAHKRKKLLGNLKGVVSLEKEDFVTFKDKRAEDLVFLDWITLARQ